MSIVTALDAEFTDHLDALQTVAAAVGGSTCQSTQRQWAYPPLGTWDGDPTNISGMDGAFKRTDLNASYVAVVSDLTENSGIGESMVVKAQLDYVAARERAFRTRYASSVRSKIHAGARRNGHGNSSGLFTGKITIHLQRLLEASVSPYA